MFLLRLACPHCGGSEITTVVFDAPFYCKTCQRGVEPNCQEVTIKFEAHITCPIEDADRVKQYGSDHRWSFSQILGDAVMGDKPYCYLNAYEPDVLALQTRVDAAVADMQAKGFTVLRDKIELIIRDSKTGVNIVQEIAGHFHAVRFD